MCPTRFPWSLAGLEFGYPYPLAMLMGQDSYQHNIDQYSWQKYQLCTQNKKKRPTNFSYLCIHYCYRIVIALYGSLNVYTFERKKSNNYGNSWERDNYTGSNTEMRPYVIKSYNITKLIGQARYQWIYQWIY